MSTLDAAGAGHNLGARVKKLNDTPNRHETIGQWTVGIWETGTRSHLRVWRDGPKLSEGTVVKAGSVWLWKGSSEFESWVREIKAGVD